MEDDSGGVLCCLLCHVRHAVAPLIGVDNVVKVFTTRMSGKVVKAMPGVMQHTEHQHEYTGDGDEDLET